MGEVGDAAARVPIYSVCRVMQAEYREKTGMGAASWLVDVPCDAIACYSTGPTRMVSGVESNDETRHLGN